MDEGNESRWLVVAGRLDGLGSAWGGGGGVSSEAIADGRTDVASQCLDSGSSHHPACLVGEKYARALEWTTTSWWERGFCCLRMFPSPVAASGYGGT